MDTYALTHSVMHSGFLGFHLPHASGRPVANVEWCNPSCTSRDHGALGRRRRVRHPALLQHTDVHPGCFQRVRNLESKHSNLQWNVCLDMVRCFAIINFIWENET
ncbi:hypothetical protein CEXT_485811 [Caerostris extrusa]|uniref:Uncharacterized protein n=1 Tax=Caerostris extrusa TaxID=172846 RepID=A0AAV4WJ54_CAEEX|nr:hypothetical protein CEXT_485811 [Caerostris extrusa]